MVVVFYPTHKAVPKGQSEAGPPNYFRPAITQPHFSLHRSPVPTIYMYRTIEGRDGLSYNYEQAPSSRPPFFLSSLLCDFLPPSPLPLPKSRFFGRALLLPSFPIPSQTGEPSLPPSFLLRRPEPYVRRSARRFLLSLSFCAEGRGGEGDRDRVADCPSERMEKAPGGMRRRRRAEGGRRGKSYAARRKSGWSA